MDIYLEYVFSGRRQLQAKVLARLGYFLLSTKAVDKAVENSKTTVITVSPIYGFMPCSFSMRKISG
jgi:hypothetical protein